ncbi:MAG: hypothetical protein M1822_002914 [Bathelium mastoideum]|nr:MAG: hypothetical protein M1822_002914 [Bathelium mastoideum]
MSRHIRFDEDNPPLAIEQPSTAVPPPILEQPPHPTADLDSDDEAPEAVTQTSARDEIKAARQEAARIIGGQRATEKQKRRSQANRLKEQAEQSRRGSKRKRAAVELSDPGSADELPNSSRKKPLPDLLPDEILAAEPPVRVPTPESEDDAVPPPPPLKTVENVEKSLVKANKAPKDVKRGRISLRVLETNNKLLPPRANAQSRNLMEAMRNRHGALETKPLKKGFATRSSSGS